MYRYDRHGINNHSVSRIRSHGAITRTEIIVVFKGRKICRSGRISTMLALPGIVRNGFWTNCQGDWNRVVARGAAEDLGDDAMVVQMCV